MNEKELAALQPVGQTAVEIRAALSRIAAAKGSAQNRIRDAQAEIEERTGNFTLASTIRNKLSDLVSDQRQIVEMLDVLADQVEAPLAAIEATEQRAWMGQERASLLDEKVALDDKWDVEYRRIAADLAALVAERQDFTERARRHGWQRGAHLPGFDAFEARTHEGQLPLTTAQRESQRLAEHRALRDVDEAINKAAACRGPLVMSDSAPRPSLTVGGELVGMPGRGWQ
jgi:hypothetical protein